MARFLFVVFTWIISATLLAMVVGKFIREGKGDRDGR